MQKMIKRIALLLVLAIAVTCAAVFATACGGNTETGYSVQVVCDDANVDLTKLSAQWCRSNEQGTEAEGNCYGRPTQLSADGKATPHNLDGTPLDLNEKKSDAPYGFHVQLNGLATIGYTYAENQSLHVTQEGTFTIKIVKAN